MKKTRPEIAMMQHYLFTMSVTLFFAWVGFAQAAGTFTDSHDDQTYKTFNFKEISQGKIVTWLAQYLNYNGATQNLDKALLPAYKLLVDSQRLVED